MLAPIVSSWRIAGNEELRSAFVVRFVRVNYRFEDYCEVAEDRSRRRQGKSVGS